VSKNNVYQRKVLLKNDKILFCIRYEANG